jgi:hypothetical protein
MARRGGDVRGKQKLGFAREWAVHWDKVQYVSAHIRHMKEKRSAFFYFDCVARRYHIRLCNKDALKKPCHCNDSYVPNIDRM